MTLYAICKMYMDSDHPEFKGFNWSSFVEQVKLCSGMGYISAYEYLLFTFCNHFIGRGRLRVISNMFQHGSLNRLPRNQIDDASARTMTQNSPVFPAINLSTEVGVIYSTGEFQHYRGVSLLAFYAELVAKNWKVAIHPIWLKQIEMCTNKDFLDEKIKVSREFEQLGFFAEPKKMVNPILYL